MSLGLLGRKVGMTRLFLDDGSAVPVTVIDVSGNRVSQVKRTASDGYDAVQITFGVRKPSRVSKAEAGHLSRAGVQAGTATQEFLDVAGEQLSAGAAISADLFQVGQKVDVTGTTIGKGFAGSIKRHNFSSNRASHGNSVSHNAPGSIGMAQDPGRVFPGKRMAGHLGAVTATTQNLEVVRVDAARQLLMLKGAVPGARGVHLSIRPAIKAGKKG